MKRNKLYITTLSIWLSELAVILMLVAFIQLELLETQQVVTIAVAMVTASVGWFVTLRMKARLDLQAKASGELINQYLLSKKGESRGCTSGEDSQSICRQAGGVR